MRSASGAGFCSCVVFAVPAGMLVGEGSGSGGLRAVHARAAVAEARAPGRVPRGVRAGGAAERRGERDEREALEVHEVPAVERGALRRRSGLAVVRSHVAEPAVLRAGARRGGGTSGGDDLVGLHPAAGGVVAADAELVGAGVRQRRAERDRERLDLRGPTRAGVAPAEVVVTTDGVVVEVAGLDVGRLPLDEGSVRAGRQRGEGDRCDGGGQRASCAPVPQEGEQVEHPCPGS